MSYVTNPLTGRPVAIGSTVYKRLVKQNLITDIPNTTDLPIAMPNQKPRSTFFENKETKPQKKTPTGFFKPKIAYDSDSDDPGYPANHIVNKITAITDKTIEKLRQSGANDDTEFDDEDIEAIKNIVIKKYNKSQ